MPAATVNPWDDDEARVPSPEDLGAGPNGKWNLLEVAPKPLRDGRFLYPDMLHRIFEAAASASAMAASLIVTVRFSGGAPVVDSFIAPRTKIVTTDIVFIDHGDGDVTVRLLAKHLPPKRVEPMLTLHEGTDPTGRAEWVEADGYRGARVRLKDEGVAADLKFTLAIY